MGLQMEKLPELSEEEIIARAEQSATIVRISRMANRVNLMLTVEKESLEYLKQDVASATKTINKIEERLGENHAS